MHEGDIIKPAEANMTIESSYINSLKGLVVFSLGEDRYCINIAEIMAIIRPEKLDQYFKDFSPPASSLKYYKNAFPIVDTKHCFGHEAGKLTGDTRVLLISCGFITMGLYADKVIEVITLDIMSESAAVDFIQAQNEPYIAGRISYDKQLLILPDIEKICSEMRPE